MFEVGRWAACPSCGGAHEPGAACYVVPGPTPRKQPLLADGYSPPPVPSVPVGYEMARLEGNTSDAGFDVCGPQPTPTWWPRKVIMPDGREEVVSNPDGDFLPGQPWPPGPVPAEPPGRFERDFQTGKITPIPQTMEEVAAKNSQADGGGLRFDQGKARFDLIAPEALYALAEHYLKGTQILKEDGTPKYAERNWERGMAWCKCFACIMRHSWKWLMGEDYDAETGSHHMIAAAWNCFAIFTYQKRGIGTDDRPTVLRSGAR